MPLTEAGRRLFEKANALWWQPNPLAGANAMQSAQIEVRAAILAIEQEAAAQAQADVARLREAAQAVVDAHIEGISVPMGEDGLSDPAAFIRAGLHLSDATERLRAALDPASGDTEQGEAG